MKSIIAASLALALSNSVYPNVPTIENQRPSYPKERLHLNQDIAVNRNYTRSPSNRKARRARGGRK